MANSEQGKGLLLTFGDLPPDPARSPLVAQSFTPISSKYSGVHHGNWSRAGKVTFNVGDYSLIWTRPRERVLPDNAVYILSLCGQSSETAFRHY